MKQKVMYLIVFLLAVGTQVEVFGQGKGDKVKNVRLTPEQRMERQIEQVCGSLMLDDATTARFAAVYRQYLKDLQTCSKAKSEPQAFAEKAVGGKKQLTDEDIEKLIEARFAKSRKILDIREKYYREFKKVLTPRQIQKVYAQEKANGVKVKKEIERRHNKKKAKNNK